MDTKNYNLDNDQDFQELKKILIDHVNVQLPKSAKKQAETKQRTDKRDEKVKKMMSGHEGTFVYEPSLQNPLLKTKLPNYHQWSDATGTKEERFPRQIATVILADEEFQSGIEVQVAVGTDPNQPKMIVSTNTNSSNQKLKKALEEQGGGKLIQDLALARIREVNPQNRQDLNKSRIARHAAKVLLRWQERFKGDPSIVIPPELEVKQDGRHAEIRIHTSEECRKGGYGTPRGTKYPCACCFIYFQEKSVEVGNRFGPMWVTMSASSYQMEKVKLLDKNFEELSDEDCQKLAEETIEKLEKFLTQGKEMGETKTEKGGTTNHDPDSDSEVEEMQWQEIENKLKTEPVKPRNQGKNRKKTRVTSSSKKPKEDITKGKKRKRNSGTSSRKKQKQD